MSVQANVLAFRQDVAKSSTTYTEWVLASGYKKINVSVNGATGVNITCDVECTSATYAATAVGGLDKPDPASVYTIGNQIVGVGVWNSSSVLDICAKWVRVKIVRANDAGANPAQVAVVISLQG